MHTFTKQSTLSSWITLASPLSAIVEIIELDGNSIVLTYKNKTPIPHYSDIFIDYFRKTAKKVGSREFRSFSVSPGLMKDQIVELNPKACPPKGTRTIIYAFLPGQAPFPDFLQDIVPRIIDAGYGPDIAVLINCCSQARFCPFKSNGFNNWMHDITYRAWKDSKWKNGSDSKFILKDNWLHLHYVAAYRAQNKKKIQLFHDHNIDKLRCKCGNDQISNLRHCKCGRMTVCFDCDDNMAIDDFITCSVCQKNTCGISRCGGRFCESGLSQTCVGYICDKCERKQPFTYCGSTCEPCRLARPENFFSCLTCSMHKCLNCLKLKCEWLNCTIGLCKECYNSGVKRRELRNIYGWKVSHRFLPTDVHLILCAPHVHAQQISISAAAEAARQAVIASAEAERMAVEASKLAVISSADPNRLATSASTTALAHQIEQAPEASVREAMHDVLDTNIELLLEDDEDKFRNRDSQQEDDYYDYSPEY